MLLVVADCSELLFFDDVVADGGDDEPAFFLVESEYDILSESRVEVLLILLFMLALIISLRCSSYLSRRLNFVVFSFLSL